VQRLVTNLGARIEGLRVFHKDAGGKYDQFQRHAWDLVRHNLDRGYPCYGFHLHAPDHYAIYGYEENEYLFTGWMEGTSPSNGNGRLD